MPPVWPIGTQFLLVELALDKPAVTQPDPSLLEHTLIIWKVFQVLA